MSDNEIYYSYKYTLGKDVDISIVELDVYSFEELDTVSMFIDNLGNQTFFMYSESNKEKKIFIERISDLLLADADAANRLAKIAHGKFMMFDNLRLKLLKS